MPTLKRAMFFIDGENLETRFRDMLKYGQEPLDGIKHAEEVFVWHNNLTEKKEIDIIRVGYYATVNPSKEKEVIEQIRSIRYTYKGKLHIQGSGGRYGNISTQYKDCSGYLVPFVYLKRSRDAKSKSVDINITLDMLSHAYKGNYDIAYLISGDGDYIPLIKAVMNTGQQVHVMALSSGLKEELKFCADEFTLLDNYLLKPK